MQVQPPIQCTKRFSLEAIPILKQESSAEDANSCQSRAGHGSGPSTGTLAIAASRGSCRGVHGGGGNSDAVARAGLNASSGASSDSSGDNRRSSSASRASTPSSPRSLSAVAGPA
jgi:hypothetical protein